MPEKECDIATLVGIYDYGTSAVYASQPQTDPLWIVPYDSFYLHGNFLQLYEDAEGERPVLGVVPINEEDRNRSFIIHSSDYDGTLTLAKSKLLR